LSQTCGAPKTKFAIFDFALTEFVHFEDVYKANGSAISSSATRLDDHLERAKWTVRHPGSYGKSLKQALSCLNSLVLSRQKGALEAHNTVVVRSLAPKIRKDGSAKFSLISKRVNDLNSVLDLLFWKRLPFLGPKRN
jgi:hypothetical protein